MGPAEPPQRKGRLAQYTHDKLLELQEKFYHREQLGVFQRPEDVGITVEYPNPSFVVKKPNGGSRLVTAFSDVGRYSKPQPSLLLDGDSTLRRIAQWSHIVTVLPLCSKVHESSFGPLWGCPTRKLLSKRLCVSSFAHSYKTGPWRKSLMICTAAATHPKSYSTTGRGSYKLYTSANCVCLPTRLSSAQKPTIFSGGSGKLAPFLPVPTVLTPSPPTLS